MKKAVIFDFDYTLGDSTEGIVKSTNYALMMLGEEEKTKEQIRRTIGLSLQETYKVLTGRNDNTRAEVFKDFFIEEANRVMVDSTHLYDDTYHVLYSLKSDGFKVGIVTTKLNSRIQSILEKFNITKFIDVIIGVENVKNVKPDPEGLNLACKKLRLNKEKVVYVGDSIVDAEAAQRAGIGFIGVLTGTTLRQEFYEYDNLHVCHDIDEVYKFVILNREEI